MIIKALVVVPAQAIQAVPVIDFFRPNGVLTIRIEQVLIGYLLNSGFRS